MLKNVRNDNNVKIAKPKKLSTKCKIKRPEEIQAVLEKNKANISSKSCKVKTISKTISFLQI